MSNVTTLEQELDSIQTEITPIGNVKKPRKNAATKTKLSTEKSVIDKLGYDANMKLNYYLKKSPQFQILENQINLLKTESENYKKNGSLENYQKCIDIITELSVKRKDLKIIFKSGETNFSQDKKDELNSKLRNSKELKELYDKRKILQKELKMNTPSFLITTISNFRKQIEFKENLSSTSDVTNFEDEIEELQTFNSFNTNTELYQDYQDFCGIIADMIMWDINEVIESPLQQIKNALIDKVKDTEKIKDEILKTTQDINNEKTSITGGTKITDLLYDIFDFKNDETEGKVPKEILAASNIGLVKSIAYNTCSKYGNLNNLDEAVGAGLLGLTVAINSWYETQKLADGALTFKGFANIYIHGAIQRELLNLSGQGRTSGSVMATKNTLGNKKIENFVKYNSEFEDIDKGFLNEMLSAYDDSLTTIGKTVTETDYSNSIAGDDGDSSEVWLNAAESDEDTSDLVEGKLEYEKMLLSIKELLNLFEHKKDKITGLLSITSKKLLDKYDKRLFLMYFGLTHKIEKNNPSESKARNNSNPGDYTQEEMAEELISMYAADGIIKTFSQAAISYRIEQMLNKLKFAIDLNPGLKAGFEYFHRYWQTNQKTLQKLSNAREEVGMKLDRDELRDIYSDDDEALNTQLSDGTKLADYFEISGDNPLDDEIMSLFNDFE